MAPSWTPSGAWRRTCNETWTRRGASRNQPSPCRGSRPRRCRPCSSMPRRWRYATARGSTSSRSLEPSNCCEPPSRKIRRLSRHTYSSPSSSGFRASGAQASRLDEALVHAERAIAVSPGVSRFEQIQAEEQRHFIRFLMNPPEPETTIHARALIASCEELLQLRPDDPDVLIGCVNFHQLTGTHNPDVAMRLAELRPNVARWQVAAAQSIMAAQPDRVDRVRHYTDRAAKLDPVGDPQSANVALARLVPAREAWLSNRPRDALRVADDLRRLHGHARGAGASQLRPAPVADVPGSRAAPRRRRGHARRLALAQPQELGGDRRRSPRGPAGVTNTARAPLPQTRGRRWRGVSLPGGGPPG